MPLSLVHDLDRVSRSWGWFLLLGLALIGLGIAGMGSVVLLTEISLIFFGSLLLVSGAMELGQSFMVREWGGFFLHLIAAALELILGLFMISHPVDAALQLTLLIGAILLVGGIFRIVAGLTCRLPQWGWAVFSGVVNVLLGIALWRNWPVSGLWFIGFCVAVDLILQGVSWTMFAFALRRWKAAPAAG